MSTIIETGRKCRLRYDDFFWSNKPMSERTLHNKPHNEKGEGLFKKLVRIAVSGAMLAESVDMFISAVKYGDINHTFLYNQIELMFDSENVNVEVPEEGSINIPTIQGPILTLTPDNQIIVTQTPVPPKSPEPAFPAEVTELQKSLGEDYTIAKGEGDYYVINGDETIKLYQAGTATIEFEGQLFTVLSADILNRGVDEEGNKILWIRGFERKQNPDTNEVSFGIALAETFAPIGADPSIYRLTEQDGRIVGHDLEGNLMFDDGKFDLHFVVENLQPEILEKTSIEPINGDRKNASREVDTYNAQTYNSHSDLLENLIGFNESDKISIPGLLLYEYPDGVSYAWGFTLNIKKPDETSFTGRHLVFVNKNGELITYPILDIPSIDVANFYDN